MKQTLHFSLFFSQVYYKDEIKGLVMYSRQRGVLLLPEMDAPSHAAYGWQFGPEADLGKDLLRNGRNTSLNLFLNYNLGGVREDPRDKLSHESDLAPFLDM